MLRLSSSESYAQDEFYRRMYIDGAQAFQVNRSSLDVEWFNQSGFWYLSVHPMEATRKVCPIPQGILTPPHVPPHENPSNASSCNLYDFRLVIFNNLDTGATVHFHGLTPPSNQDGVPFVANANIHADNLQYYRFHQFTYAGMHWMHSHTGFLEAFGVATPIIFHHSESYHKASFDNRYQDLIAVLEEGFVYPHCAYSKFWYALECSQISNSTKEANMFKLAFFLNRKEEPLEFSPESTTETVRIRLLNAGSEAPWRITDQYSREMGGAAPGMEVLATDGNDVQRGIRHGDFVLGLANRMDVMVPVNDTHDTLITAVQMMHSDNVTNPVLRHIIIHGTNSKPDNWIDPSKLNLTGSINSYIDSNFSVLDSLEAVHPLSDRPITKNFTVMNKGGDQYGGFPLAIYDGIVTDVHDESSALYKVSNFTQLNQLKFQLPPYKVYRHRGTGNTISTRRECNDCEFGSMNYSGLKNRPDPNNNGSYFIGYADGHDPNEPFCCWEWCDVPSDECSNYDLVDVDGYESNQHYIPVCYGDRVRILFVNVASFESAEGHPMHLHGHNFALRELYDVVDNRLELTKEYDISGPLLDTIWVPYGKAVSFDFDAYNPGEHLFHCHNDFHLENGMMTTLRYMSVNDGCSEFPKIFTGGKSKYPSQFCNMDGCN